MSALQQSDIDDMPAESGATQELTRSRRLSPLQRRAEQLFRLISETMKALPDLPALDRRTYEKGETILASGDLADGEIYFLKAGMLSITRTDPQSGDVDVEHLQAPGLVGLDLALAEADRDVDGNIMLGADSTCTIIIIDSETIDTLAKTNTAIQQAMISFLGQLCADRSRRMVRPMLATKTRIFSHLLDMTERDPVNYVWMISVLPKHRDLAAELNVDDTAVANAIAELIGRNIAVRCYPGLQILDMGKFQKISS